MQTSIRVVQTAASLLALVAFAGGCGASDEPADPTSAEALRKADPVTVSCSYVQTFSSSYGTASSSKDTPECDNTRCGDVRDPNDDYVAYGGGAEYVGYTYNHDMVSFVGTCSGPRTAISCDDMKNDGDACDACLASSCCTSVFLCEHDPNCQAISDCVTTCKEDTACGQRCVDNGEPTASKSFAGTVECLTGSCASACGQAATK